jgi:asparagine synthase (glutamine-hydrolysing)
MVNGYPIEHRTATDHSDFYQLCASYDVGSLYSGFGGDEAVTNEGGGILFELLDGRDYVNLFKMMRGSLPIRIYRASIMAFKGYSQPRVNPAELQAYRERWKYSPVSEGIDEVFGINKAYLAQADWGSELRRINSEVLCRINRPYVQTRLENCTLLAASYGIDYAWPLLDSRLIQQWLSTPSIWKVGDGRLGRYLHRSAVSGVCPDEVTWKQDKDMGFAPVYQHFDQQSNRRYFEALLALAEELPGPLIPAIDPEKIRNLALEGIKSAPRGYEVYSALEQTTNQIGSLIEWLNQDA